MNVGEGRFARCFEGTPESMPLNVGLVPLWMISRRAPLWSAMPEIRALPSAESRQRMDRYRSWVSTTASG